MTSDPLDPIQTEYQAAKVAFERGDYRQSVERLERAQALVNLGSTLGGEVQIWLVTAYEAADRREEAIALCRKLTHHPNLKTRQESKRILYILEAPKLKTRPEWLTEIPDLATLTEAEAKSRYAASTAPRRDRPVKSPQFPPKPVDLSQVNTEDNRFIWVALVAGLLILVGLIGLG